MFDIKPYFPTKVLKRNRKNSLFDPIRKKLILHTPEEMVRQAFIQFLIKKKGVPQDMIEVEVPMSYFSRNAKVRADTIVNTIQNKKLVPILVVECKSLHTTLIDEVFDQVYDYEEVL